jgi:branched-chain amino acid transport system substrate-binding protein
MSHGVASKKFIELAGDAAQGIVLPAGRLALIDQVPDNHPQKAVLVAYRDMYAKKYNAPVSTFGGYAWDGLQLVLNAVKAGKSALPKDIRDNLEKTKDFAATTGLYTYSPANHNGLDESAFVMVVIDKGDWKVAE